MSKSHYDLTFALAALLLAGQPALSYAQTAPTSSVWQQLPQVSGPIPVTATSWPLLRATAAMEKAGYVEEEYFLTGQARTYDWDGRGHKVKAIAGPGKYVTRILVRRPRDPARFSGNVEVIVLNASLNIDFGGPTDFGRMVKQGDVWIGISTKPVTAAALKNFDPARYAPLDWSNPAPAAKRCSAPSSIPSYMAGGKEAIAAMLKAGAGGSVPETEDGLVWDMLGQLGLLLKSEQRGAILPGFSKPFVYMTGISQSAIYIRTWMAGFHDRYRTPDRKPVYDGYLAIVGPAMVKINQCAEDVALEDPRQKLSPPDVPFISISSEGEMWQARYTHQADVFTRTGGLVTYEVTGGSHQAGEVPGLPADTIGFGSIPDMMKAGFKMPDASSASGLMPSGTQHNDFVWAPLVRGAYFNLQQWVRKGIRPPQAPGIAVGSNHEIERDQYGNAIGGLRMPYVDAPIAGHTGYISAGGFGGVMGFKKPLTSETLKTLYPDHAAYVAQFSAATDRLVAGRWITAEDAEAMKKAAAAQHVPD